MDGRQAAARGRAGLSGLSGSRYLAQAWLVPDLAHGPKVGVGTMRLKRAQRAATGPLSAGASAFRARASSRRWSTGAGIRTSRASSADKPKRAK